MSIPNLYKINDTRLLTKFSKYTFCDFQKKDVSNILVKSIDEGKIETACNWCVEYIVSGYDYQLYEKFILYYCKYINLNNPRLPKLLLNRFNNYTSLKNSIYNNNPLEVRNNQTIRNHTTELCCILCNSKKTKGLAVKKINNKDFTTEVFKTKLKSKEEYIEHLYRVGDTNEIKIVMNEFYHSLINKSYDSCLYWISWLVGWEKIVIKKKGIYKCGYREIKNIDMKYYTDFIWFVWEILLKYSLKQYNDTLNDQIQALYVLFKYEYSSSKKNKRICIVLTAIKYFTEFYDINIPLIFDYNIIIQACGNINYMYNLKKQHEQNTKEQINNKIDEFNNVVNNMEAPRGKLLEKKPTEKKKKIKISEDSNNKINLVEKIDSMILKKSTI